MAWYRVYEYAKRKSCSPQAVYKWIKAGKMKSKEIEKGVMYVWEDSEKIDEQNEQDELKEIIKKDSTIEYYNIKELLEGLILDLKKHGERGVEKVVNALSSEALNMFRESKDNEIKTLNRAIDELKESRDREIKGKDEQIERLTKELEKVRDNNSLFKRLFGG